MAKADAWGAPEGTAFERREARGDGLAGNTRLIAGPPYRRLLAAEPLLRRSIPALIITFLIVIAALRVLSLMNERDDVERDAKAILSQLEAAALKHGALPHRYAAWCAKLLTDEEKARAELAQYERADTRPINHYRLARAIADAIDPDTIVIGDGGDCVAMAARVLGPERPGHWLDPGPLGCLGVGAPFALAAKKMYPDKKVLVIGDRTDGAVELEFNLLLGDKPKS